MRRFFRAGFFKGKCFILLYFLLLKDTQVERNMLMENIYPKLKEYCRERGLEFQVVDMRWGVRDESTDDHKTADLCMNEIDNCQRLSLGPNFVVRSLKKYSMEQFI
jgi:hypothetical protein